MNCVVESPKAVACIRGGIRKIILVANLCRDIGISLSVPLLFLKLAMESEETYFDIIDLPWLGIPQRCSQGPILC